MPRVVVTGGSGKLGRACVQDLVEHGYEVINGDIFPPKESQCPFFKIDFENMAQTIDLLSAMDFEHSLWGYIDARDGAQAIRKSLEAPLKGANVFIIANADTVLSRPNKEVSAEFYPGVPFKREMGPNETLLSIEKARRVLGYEPQYSWRKEAT